jgi:uncharacterized SAM-binding protein YcdF (DUF218 family)
VKTQPTGRLAVSPGAYPFSGKKQPALQYFLSAGALLLLLVILAFAFRSRILTGFADYLIIKDRLQPADAIVLLNGEYDSRPFRAGELYLQGLAPVIVVARAENTPAVDLGLVPNDTDISVSVMEKLGVPPEKMIILPVPGGTTSTFDEAALVKQYVEANQVHRIILVTSAFHTRRARWIFQKAFAGLPVTLEMAAAPHIGFDQTNWWKNETGLITLNNEYIKLAYYLIKYR